MKLIIQAGEKKYTGTFQNFAVINTDLRAKKKESSEGFTLLASTKASYRIDEKYLYDAENRIGIIDKNNLRVTGDHFVISAAENEEPIETMIDGDKGPLLPIQIEVCPKAMEFFYNSEEAERSNQKDQKEQNKKKKASEPTAQRR